MKLEGRVAIVTGASRGIGKAIALALAREGAKVVVAARTEVEKGPLPGTIHKTAEEIAALGGTALPVRCDITQDEEVENLARRTREAFGRVDVLVNNAGVNFRNLMVDFPIRRWDLIMRVNLRGTFICTKAVLPTMIQQRRGSIINISSVGARFQGPPGVIPYGLSKAGVDFFTIGLAEEVRGYNIAVNALMPSSEVATEGRMLVFKDAAKAPQQKSPQDMARAAVFLALQDAQGFTGRLFIDAQLIHGLYAEHFAALLGG